MSDPSETQTSDFRLSDFSADLPQCSINEEWRGDTVVLGCSGVIDMLTAPELQRRIDEALAQHPSAMIVDLTGVEFLASHGMSVLVTAHDSCVGTTAFTVVADGPTTSRPMQIVGLDQMMRMVPTLDDAQRGVGV